jgi:HSP20 family molecular chaperone IbpA
VVPSSACGSSRAGCHGRRKASEEAKAKPADEDTPKDQSSDEEERLIYRDRNSRAYETKDSYRFVFDLPGVKEDDVEIVLEGNFLRLKAERKSGDTVVRKHDEKFVIHRAHIEATEIVSVLEDGVLTVTLKKSEAMKPFHVQVIGSDPPAPSDESTGLLLTIDVPGVKASDASVEYKDGYLHVQYKRKNQESTRKYAVNPSTLDLAKAEAYLADGVLTIKAPARPAKKVKLADKKDETKALENSSAAKAEAAEGETKSDKKPAPKEGEADDAKEYEIVVETADDE